jgi:hypothetical protein
MTVVEGLKTKLMATTPKDLLMITAVTGAVAGFVGLMTLVDRELFSYTLGFKPRYSRAEVTKRGAIVGLIAGLPFVFAANRKITTDDLLNPLEGVHSAQKFAALHDSSRIKDYVTTRFTKLPTPPENYIYTTDEAGRQILILDPKTGL